MKIKLTAAISSLVLFVIIGLFFSLRVNARINNPLPLSSVATNIIPDADDSRLIGNSTTPRRWRSVDTFDGISISNGTNTTTLLRDSFTLNRGSASSSGVFNINRFGNTAVSGTVAINSPSVVALTVNSTTLQVDALDGQVSINKAPGTGTALDVFGTEIVLERGTANTGGASMTFRKTRGTASESHTALLADDTIGTFSFEGSDGTAYVTAGSVRIEVDGSVSGGVVPSRLTFSTADTAGTLTEAVRVNTGQNVGIGATVPDRRLHAELSTARTGSIQFITRFTHITTGVSTIGYGVGWETELEDAAGNNETAAEFAVTWTDAANGSEDSAFRINTMGAGVTSTLFLVNSSTVAVASTTPSFTSRFVVDSAVTTTVTVGSSHASRGGCLEMQDVDGVGYSRLYVINGTLTTESGRCQN